MPFDDDYDKPEPTRDEVDAWPGMTVLEFGASWCEHCQGAQSDIRSVLEERTDLRHVKIADGPGRPLGRSFRVKLWPTLIFLSKGRELARVVRPENESAIRQSLEQALAASGT